MAEELGVSSRSVENYVKRGKLSVRYEKGATSDVAVFDPFEVRRLKAELQSRTALVPQVSRETPEREARNPEIAPQSLLAPAPLADYLSRIADALEGREAPELLTLEEVRERLKVSEWTVRRLVAKGSLRAVHIGRLLRFRPADLRAFIEGL